VYIYFNETLKSGLMMYQTMSVYRNQFRYARYAMDMARKTV
jgi:hypothetical protein